MKEKDTDAALGDIFYEASELLLLYETYFSKGREHPDPLLRNAVLEKSLVHTRNLIDFFELVKNPKNYPVTTFLKAYPDDVNCEDFGYPPRILVIEKGLKSRINKRVAHLTYARATLSKYWHLSNFVPTIMIECREFFIRILEDSSPYSTHLPREQIEIFISQCRKYD